MDIFFSFFFFSSSFFSSSFVCSLCVLTATGLKVNAGWIFWVFVVAVCFVFEEVKIVFAVSIFLNMYPLDGYWKS